MKRCHPLEVEYHTFGICMSSWIPIPIYGSTLEEDGHPLRQGVANDEATTAPRYCSDFEDARR